jgi:hypothetical protein
MSPTGVFECRVPPMGGEALVVASITITSGQSLQVGVDRNSFSLVRRWVSSIYSGAQNILCQRLSWGGGSN